MKILALNNQSRILGGSETVFMDTTEGLRSLGHEVHTVCAYGKKSSGDGGAEICLGKDGLKKKALSIIDPFAAASVKRKISEFRPDVVHSHIIYGGLTYSVARAISQCGVPHVMTVHEYKLLCPTFTMINGKGEICSKCVDGGYWHAVSNKCKRSSYLWSMHSALDSYVRSIVYSDLREIDRLIFVSKFARDLHIKHQPWIESRSSHVYNPIELPPGSPGLSVKDRKGCLYVGRLSPEKGLNTLISAVQNTDGVDLTIVGDGPQRNDLEAMVINNDLSARIKFLGFLPREEIFELMRKHKYLVIPSEWYENNPMSLLEAMASGLPAIGTRIGGIPELIINNETGFLHEPFDANGAGNVLRSAMALSDEQWQRLSDNAQLHVETNMARERYFVELLDQYKLAMQH